MILKHLINSKSFVIFFIIIFLFALNIIPFIRNSFFDVYDHLFLNPIIEYVLVTVLVFLNAMKLNNIIYEKSIIRKNNLVVACVFLLLNTFFINDLLSLIYCYIFLRSGKMNGVVLLSFMIKMERIFSMRLSTNLIVQ